MRIGWGMWLLALWILAGWILVACDAPRPIGPPAFSPTPMPAPTTFWAAVAPALPADVAAGALGEPGGLEGVFISLQHTAGANATQCHTLYRFYADGQVLLASGCFDRVQNGADWPAIDTWLTTENPELPRGDYFRQGDSVLLRIVDYDLLERAPYLRLARGEICGDKIMLQRLALAGDRVLAPIGSTPVTELQRVPLPHDLPPALSPAGESPVKPAPGVAECRVAAWQFEWQTGIGLAGHDAEYRIRTEPGTQCTLHYTPPARADDDSGSNADSGSTPPALPTTGSEDRSIPGTGLITADATGLCAWRWPLGDVAGAGVVTVAIGTIVQDYAIVVNGPRPSE